VKGSQRGGLLSFRAAYASALSDYLRQPTESSLRVAYELGRDAVGRRLSVLDLAVAHQDALVTLLAGDLQTRGAQGLVRAAGDFFLESLGSFEMVQRGAAEAREAVLAHRRRAELARQLSTFLADSSLALKGHDPLPEMLQLAADQGREVLLVQCCLATVIGRNSPRAVQGVSHPASATYWPSLIRWMDLRGIYRLLAEHGGSIRLTTEQIRALPVFSAQRSVRPPSGWLAVSLTALDGSQIGALQAFDKEDGELNADDEAAFAHLALIVSGAIERVQLYQQKGQLGP
jgi:hypothetical protein